MTRADLELLSRQAWAATPAARAAGGGLRAGAAGADGRAGPGGCRCSTTRRGRGTTRTSTPLIASRGYGAARCFGGPDQLCGTAGWSPPTRGSSRCPTTCSACRSGRRASWSAWAAAWPCSSCSWAWVLDGRPTPGNLLALTFAAFPGDVYTQRSPDVARRPGGPDLGRGRAPRARGAWPSRPAWWEASATRSSSSWRPSRRRGGSCGAGTTPPRRRRRRCWPSPGRPSASSWPSPSSGRGPARPTSIRHDEGRPGLHRLDDSSTTWRRGRSRAATARGRSWPSTSWRCSGSSRCSSWGAGRATRRALPAAGLLLAGAVGGLRLLPRTEQDVSGNRGEQRPPCWPPGSSRSCALWWSSSSASVSGSCWRCP